jgi:ribosomal protein S18 acetylase RimI-like enzyme
MPIEIKLLRSGDEAQLERVAPGVFDEPLDAKATRAFLADHRHHLAVAIDDGHVVGFVSAVLYVHPDKPRPELWINEVAVASNYRRRGAGKAMLSALLAFAQSAGCSEAWVLTDRRNDAAMRLYSSLGGDAASEDTVMFTFRLDTNEKTLG